MAALDAALGDTALTGSERRFLRRLCTWDKRSASCVARLLWRARLRGRTEAGLTPRQLELVLAALADAFTYRSSGYAAVGCWDCADLNTGLCAEHARDSDRARAFAEVVVELSGGLGELAVLGRQAARSRAVTPLHRRTRVAS